MSAIPYSVLDLVPVAEGSQPTESFRRSLDLARHAERLGYCRYWLAEHHNMPGIASAATSVLIGHLAGGTNTLRIGAGASCCRTTRRWSSPSSSAPWRRSIRIASIWGLAVRRAPISAPCGRSDASAAVRWMTSLPMCAS